MNKKKKNRLEIAVFTGGYFDNSERKVLRKMNEKNFLEK